MAPVFQNILRQILQPRFLILLPCGPPGYPVLLAPILKLFDFDLAVATTAIDLTGSIAIIFMVRWIAVEINFPAAAVNIMTLITGCFEYPFIAEALPTDIPAFAFFLGGFLLFLQTVKSEKIFPVKLLIASLLLFLPCLFRYSYPPLSIAIPAAAIYLGWHQHNKKILKQGLISLAHILVLLTSLFVFIKNQTGAAAFIVDTGRGFYPENLLHCAPAVPGSFINTFFVTSQLIDKAGLSLADSMMILEAINGLMILLFVILFFNLWLGKKIFKTPDPFRIFLFLGFAVAAASFISLAYLSLTYKPQAGFGAGWNYLNELRYFMFVNVFLQLLFMGSIFLYTGWEKNILQKILVTILSILLFVEISHNIYFYSKVALAPAKYATAPYEEADYTWFTHTLESLNRENPAAEIWVVAESDDFFPLMAAYQNHKGVYNGTALITAVPVVKKETIVLFALYDNEVQAYQSFFDSRKVTLLNKVNGVNFYRLILLQAD